eukprot:CAMPEP_0195629972 /NCGR_PEP_ID=MMETSP0815-20121206/20281_1 /TAXON_ID=97485 /ORGANISM="Prymnesium parvum, Strain Texoma1" /LENGTH=87 /DNA_ID=CAMNT_0040771371 /DNA_START=670 /DNA_END=934 /DNA_ORIENTATION=+
MTFSHNDEERGGPFADRILQRAEESAQGAPGYVSHAPLNDQIAWTGVKDILDGHKDSDPARMIAKVEPWEMNELAKLREWMKRSLPA